MISQHWCTRLRQRRSRAATLLVALSLLLVALPEPAHGAAQCRTPGGSNWIDPDTPAAACTKRVCTGTQRHCASAGHGAQQELALVFSDEFDTAGRDFTGPTGDRRWTAFNGYYAADFQEQQMYVPSALSVSGGALHITLADNAASGTFHGAGGESVVHANKTSGMLQGWNKFCFTGGLVEFAIRLPGTSHVGGLWPAAWLLGNLGRAGHVASTEGLWPFSFSTCAGSGVLPWSPTVAAQRISACSHPKGRGVPEIDVMEFGVFDGQPLLVNTLQTAPTAPPGTSWMLANGTGAPPGIALPGAHTPLATQLPSARFFGPLSRPGFPRPGKLATDSLLATSTLTPQHFDVFHTYSMLWEPGKLLRWSVDDVPLFEVTSEALRAQANAAGEAIGPRLIPVEPMYMLLNLAMSNTSWARISPDLQLPAVMSVDYVRVWQRWDAVNVGCSPPGWPTQQWIACHKSTFVAEAEYDQWRLGACRSLVGSREDILLAVLGCLLATSLLATGVMLGLSRWYAPGARRATCMPTPWLAAEAPYLAPGPAALQELRRRRPDVLARCSRPAD